MYTVGDQWSDITALDWCSATDNVDANVTCEIVINNNPLVDTSQAGTYTITYQAVDIAGNIATETIEVVVIEEQTGTINLSAYYQTASDLDGEALFLELRSIIQNGMIKISYGDGKYLYQEMDRDPNNANNVLTIYDRQSVSGIWNGTTFNREHVWPNSRLGVPRVTNTQRNIASDLHNLRAAIVGTNSSRGNKWFDVSTTSSTYYPGLDDRGDVARILFYMVVMYPQLEIVQVITAAMDANTYKAEGAYMAKMSTLLQWHYEDPVDDFERNRNDVIFSYQNNRNPFIDHPEFSTLIWGNNPSVVTSSNMFIN